MRDGVIVTSSYLTGEEPVRSDRYEVQGIECHTEHGEFDYCDGLQKAWITNKVLVNIEHDMEHSDALIDGLVNCPYPVCAYAYQVYPTALGRYIYCATSRKVWKEEDEADYRMGHEGTNPSDLSGVNAFDRELGVRKVGDEYISWLDEGDQWAVWSSIGFCKIAPVARTKPLDRLFWMYIEHSVNRSVGKYMNAGGANYDWHIHWNEGKGIQHHHDYLGEKGAPVPDHLW